jgi:adenylate kinase
MVIASSFVTKAVVLWMSKLKKGDMMKVVLLGAPGAGKGTQAAFICQKFNIPKISTGDMLRAAVEKKTPLGLRVAEIMSKGQLVSDTIVIEMVRERLQESDCQNGYLFDGFPRTVPQAEALLATKIHIDCVLEIAVPDEEIIQRLSGRWVHPPSGRVYHTEYNPPAVLGRDDETGEPLLQREDDKKDTVLKRLTVYHQMTRPLVEWYRLQAKAGAPLAPRFERILGVGQVQEIEERVARALMGRGAQRTER